MPPQVIRRRRIFDDQPRSPAPSARRSYGPERKLFVDLVLGCRPDHFQPTDAPLLAAYCRAVCLEQTASSEMAFVIDGRPSGWLNVLAQATRTISTYSRMLKLNPAGRQSTPSPEAQPISAYERIALEAQRDGRN